MGIRRQGESGRLAVIGAVLIALIAATIIAFNAFTTHANPGGSAMSIGVCTELDKNPTPSGLSECTGSVETGKVDIPANTTFTIHVSADTFPAPGYVGVQAWIDYGDTGLSGNKNHRRLWPDFAAAFVTGQNTNAEFSGGLTGSTPPLPLSTHKGGVLTYDLTCGDSGTSHTVLLIASGDVNAGGSGSGYADENLAGVPAENTEIDGRLVADSVDINCLGATDTPTPSATPTVTPTPTAGEVPDGPRISLAATGAGVSCQPVIGAGTPTPTPFPKPAKCTAPFFPGQTKVGEFTLSVRANEPPAAEYGGFRTEIEFESGLVYNARTACEDEVVWPDAAATNSCDRLINSSVDHTVTSASAAPFPLSDHVGSLLELDVHCTKVGEFQIRLTEAAYLEADGDDAEAVGLFDDPHVYILRINCQLQPPEMSLTAFGPGVSCAPAGKPIKCTAPFSEGEDQLFTIAVDANAIPNGYMGFQTQLAFGGLAYHPRSCLDEVIWRPDNPTLFVCEPIAITTPVPNTDQRRHRVRTGEFGPWPANFDVGRLVEYEVSCKSANQFFVALPAYTTVGQATGQPFIEHRQGSTFYNADDSLIFAPKVDGGQSNPNIVSPGHGPVLGATLRLADTLRINCEAPPPTPTPTVSPTVTPTGLASPTPTETPCDGPCPTPTPTNTPTRTNTPTNTSPPTNTPTLTNTPTPAPVELEQTVPPGGKVSTGLFASPSLPVVTSVTLPLGGTAFIQQKMTVQPNPPGFSLLPWQVNLSAPGGQPQNPLQIIFQLDASIAQAAGVTHATVTVFKDGVPVPACTGPSGKASPNPCVAKRNTLTGQAAGDIQLTILSTDASSWTFGAVDDEKPDLGDVNGDGAVNPADALLILQLTAGMVSSVPHPNVADVNGDGLINPTDAALILQHAAGLITGFPAGSVSGWSGLDWLNDFWPWLRL